MIRKGSHPDKKSFQNLLARAMKRRPQWMREIERETEGERESERRKKETDRVKGRVLQ